MVPIKIENLSFYYGNRRILENINFEIKEPGFYAILGPNGSGKTTLLYNILKLLPPSSGRVLLQGEDIRRKRQKEIARFISLVPQRYEFRYPFTVEEVLAMGRYPYLSLLDFGYKNYKKRVKDVAGLLGIESILDRPVTLLSGGQVQRVVIGKVLVQDTPVCLLDEPISSLDIKYKLHILKYFKALSRNKVVLISFHELDLVGFFADVVIFLKDGRIFDMGKIEEVFTPENIREVFDIDVLIRKKGKFLEMDINWEVFQ